MGYSLWFCIFLVWLISHTSDISDLDERLKKLEGRKKGN